MRIQRQQTSCHLVKQKVKILEVSWAFNQWRFLFDDKNALTQVLSKITRQREYAIKLMAVQIFFISSGLFVLTSKSLAQSMLCWTKMWKKMRSRPSPRGLFCAIIRQCRKKMLTSWTPLYQAFGFYF